MRVCVCAMISSQKENNYCWTSVTVMSLHVIKDCADIVPNPALSHTMWISSYMTWICKYENS